MIRLEDRQATGWLARTCQRCAYSAATISDSFVTDELEVTNSVSNGQGTAFVFGWAMTIKSVVYSLAPSTYNKVATAAIDSVSRGKVRTFQAAALSIAATSGWILVDGWL